MSDDIRTVELLRAAQTALQKAIDYFHADSKEVLIERLETVLTKVSDALSEVHA